MTPQVLRTTTFGGYRKEAVIALLDEANALLMSAEDGGMSYPEIRAGADDILNRVSDLPSARMGGFVKEDVEKYFSDLIEKICSSR